MKKIWLGCCLLVLITSCGGKKQNIDPFEMLTKQIDSVSHVPDTVIVHDTVPNAEEIIPVTADESFADFFYNFASDERFQRSRIVFPISYYTGKEIIQTEKDDWNYDPMFSRDLIYTILFDDEEDMEMEKDTGLYSVQVDRIYLRMKKIKRYYFQRIHERWFLEAINQEDLNYPDSEEENFFDFYTRFANDSIFQLERIQEPLAFVTVDPEDDFQILETVLNKGQWFSFCPPLLKERLTDIHYGQKDDPESDLKIIEIKGFGNGFNNTLYFRKINGIWKLIRFEDLSD